MNEGLGELRVSQTLFYWNLCVAWLLWHAAWAACGAHPSVASDKLWHPVSHAVCGSRFEQL